MNSNQWNINIKKKTKISNQNNKYKSKSIYKYFKSLLLNTTVVKRRNKNIKGIQ